MKLLKHKNNTDTAIEVIVNKGSKTKSLVEVWNIHDKEKVYRIGPMFINLQPIEDYEEVEVEIK